MVSAQKSDVNLIEDPLYVMISRFQDSFHSLVVMCLGLNLFEFILLAVCSAS